MYGYLELFDSIDSYGVQSRFPLDRQLFRILDANRVPTREISTKGKEREGEFL